MYTAIKIHNNREPQPFCSIFTCTILAAQALAYHITILATI